ncbi:helicase-related protein [Schinkia azotoformans]|uniref:helicase-related protein n=1 Tax=Schinkia azotoformans TaxID=1454 RepID=UPI002DBABB9E|nr:helicase-related protein [Schinkia azotoformans]MEC1721793.1 helicase-related protein [Schinkia azotoformans]MED4414943.1 helicase-related protein [Schinkia azotoformans]
MNGILADYYSKAVERAKTMVMDDIDKYLETKEDIPSYEQYIRERGQFIGQIWLNAWLNATSSHASINEKVSYLTSKGFDVEGVKQKLINQMFRNEIREEESFDVICWLDTKFLIQKEVWVQRYKKVRESHLCKKAIQIERESKRKLFLKLEYHIEQLLGEYYEEFYLYIRFLLGSQLAIEIEKQGVIQPMEDVTFSSYLYDEQESAYHNYRFVEEITEKYERLISTYLFDFGPNWLKNHLPSNLFDEYKESFGKPLSIDILKEVSFEPLADLSYEIFEDLLNELMTDLIKLIDIPFDLEKHREIFNQDIMERKRKEIEEQEKRQRQKEEEERRKEEEKRMIEDIFGMEYSPPPSRNIQYILHVGETNTGKTFQAIENMKAAKSGIYLAPLRLLAFEIYDKLNEEGVPCSLKTGEEEKVVTDATHFSCTVEMFHEKDYYDVVVIDEAQMLADKDRGFSWYKAITKAKAKEVHIICSFNAKSMILDLLGESDVDVFEYRRDIPLEVEQHLFRLNDTRKGDALVCFSRRQVLETASELQRGKRKVSMIYGSMPPETRKKQMQRFLNGETTVIVATDAIGMGLNLPIRRIVFLENEKFDGTRRRRLTSQEVKQIAGRAGRKGIYDVGKVAFYSDPKTMGRLLEQEDQALHGFAIAPTTGVLEKFQKYSRHLGLFFYLWDKFKIPEGTKKAPLSEEKLLYEMIEGTIVEAKLSLTDLYGFLHLPFSTNEPTLRVQWKQKLEAIVAGEEIPDPIIKESGLEELELSYKSIGLHLLFLYKLGRATEAQYWERIREEISDKIHDQLKSGIQVARKVCKSCGKDLPLKYRFNLCDDCFYEKRSRKYQFNEWELRLK